MPCRSQKETDGNLQAAIGRGQMERAKVALGEHDGEVVRPEGLEPPTF